MRSIRLMGEEVIPALREVRPPEGIYDELAAAPPVTTADLQRARSGLAPSDAAAST